MYANLLDAQSADLALAFGDSAQPLGGISLHARAKHVWFLHEPSDWGDLLDAAAEVGVRVRVRVRGRVRVRVRGRPASTGCQRRGARVGS